MTSSPRRTADATGNVPGPALDYAGDIGDPVIVIGTVTRKDTVLGRFYSTVSTLLEIDCGTSIVTVFSTARWAKAAQPGQRLTISGTVKKHQNWHGTPQTVLGWTRLIETGAADERYPAGEPDSQPAPRWPPGIARTRRRFQDDQNPAAATLFESPPAEPTGQPS